MFFFQLSVLYAVDGGTPIGSVPQRCRTTGVVGVVATVGGGVVEGPARQQMSHSNFFNFFFFLFHLSVHSFSQSKPLTP